jgi:alkanesulfonate monooxygenase SsuD/methylene tetrahydromethanopterin reductase-like flavin-dependent oxidoreductase (luciferase family)
MKFGLFVNSQQPRGDDPVLRFRQCVQQVIVARDTGFDAIAAGHHYVSPPYIAIQNLPFLARLAADSGQMDLVLAVTLLALLNPVQTAEEIASLDVMSEGRVVFGVGIGYREEEFQAFGLQVSDRVPRMLEGLKLIKRLWTRTTSPTRAATLICARRPRRSDPCRSRTRRSGSPPMPTRP